MFWWGLFVRALNERTSHSANLQPSEIVRQWKVHGRRRVNEAVRELRQAEIDANPRLYCDLQEDQETFKQMAAVYGFRCVADIYKRFCDGCDGENEDA